jgi:hypothetical protein
VYRAHRQQHATLVLPLYNLSPIPEDAVILLLLRSLTMNGTLSAYRSCIGSYNAGGLDPANACQPDRDVRAFFDGGNFTAFLSLEDADTFVINVLGQSLCVLLSGDPAMWGDGGSPQRCARDGVTSSILFHGDWCQLTNGPADSKCYDSMRFQGSFAASAVELQ